MNLFGWADLSRRLFRSLVSLFRSSLSLLVIHVNVLIVFWFCCKSKNILPRLFGRCFLRLLWLRPSSLLRLWFGLLCSWSFLLLLGRFGLRLLLSLGIFGLTSWFSWLGWRCSCFRFSRWRFSWRCLFFQLFKLRLQLSCRMPANPLGLGCFDCRLLRSCSSRLLLS